jgi:hypothetical protein
MVARRLCRVATLRGYRRSPAGLDAVTFEKHALVAGGGCPRQIEVRGPDAGESVEHRQCCCMSVVAAACHASQCSRRCARGRRGQRCWRLEDRSSRGHRAYAFPYRSSASAARPACCSSRLRSWLFRVSVHMGERKSAARRSSGAPRRSRQRQARSEPDTRATAKITGPGQGRDRRAWSGRSCANWWKMRLRR